MYLFIHSQKPSTAAQAHVNTSVLPTEADWHSCLSVFFIFSLAAGRSLSTEAKELHLLGMTDLYSVVNA